MMENNWVLFDINGQPYGIRTHFVIEMIMLDKVEKIPKAPPSVRGVTTRRGQVFPVVDMRRWLGMQSLLEEQSAMAEMLDARKQDHVNWLQELKASVEEDRPFTLATDPHKCAFGKWYDQFDTDNITLRSALLEFNGPNRAIHHLADKVEKVKEAGKSEEALAIIKSAWQKELATMLRLFDNTTAILTQTTSEIVIVTEIDGRKLGLIVDDVRSVAVLEESGIEPPDEAGVSGTAFLEGVYKGEDDNYLLIDAGRVSHTLKGVQAPAALGA